MTSIEDFRREAKRELAATLDAFTVFMRALCADGPCIDYYRLHACRWNYGPHLELGYGLPRTE